MSGELLWHPSPERVAQSRLKAFIEFLESRQGIRFKNYDELHVWSVESLGPFWQAVADFSQLRMSGEIESVVDCDSMPGARWFTGGELNFTEHLLYPAVEIDESAAAIAFESERTELRRTLSWRQLREAVARCAAGLTALGVKPGDRVAGFVPNVPEAVIAMLATASIGAIWSSCSPDFGPQGILDRFGQIEPVVLFAADGYEYGGKRFGLGERIRSLLDRLPTLRNVVVFPFAGQSVEGLRGQLSWDELLAASPPYADPPQFPFAHPLYILYTSGTTGRPKCLVHSAGGTLLKHLQEHQLQTDIGPNDVLFYFTTCGWMMWNWLVTGLASGATIVLYDGSPAHPDVGRLFRMIDERGVTHFGTSPRFLSLIEKEGYVPRAKHRLASLRTIMSTGSPLHASQFEWIYRDVKDDVQVASISGGTDIVGCFVLGAPTLPVYAGEIQCRALGMQVESLNEQGQPVIGEKGELACATPFPSMPLGFWKDPTGERYKASYFERFPGKWHHGDFVEITERGSVIIHGRSDATLNPGGVRIGTAEIYRVLESIQGISDTIAVGLEEAGDVKILLFVVLVAGSTLDEVFTNEIRQRIRREASPRHVPAEIHQIEEIPRTISGKPVELAITRILQGEDPGNRDALANPAALDQFSQLRR